MHPFRKLTLSAAVALAVSCAAVLADPPAAPADRIEEDWQLVVSTPDFQGVGPQITTAMSPTSDGSSAFVAFDMNYQEFPSFVPGGMQLQVWSGDDVLATSTQGTAQFNTPNETITWTQRMSVSEGSIRYDITNGNSTTWGAFGQGNGDLGVTFTSPQTTLADYDPAVSVEKSGVTWESNYVAQMTLLQVRYYAAGNLIKTDTKARDIKLGD